MICYLKLQTCKPINNTVEIYEYSNYGQQSDWLCSLSDPCLSQKEFAQSSYSSSRFVCYIYGFTNRKKKPHSAYRQIIEITGSIWHIFPLESSTIKNEYFVLIPWCFIIGRTGCHTEKSFQLCSHWKTTFFCVSFSSKRLWHLKGVRNGIVETQGRIRYSSTQSFIHRYEGRL